MGVALVSAALSSCAGDGAPPADPRFPASSTATVNENEMPRCADLAGTNMTADFQGCLDGVIEKEPLSSPCEDGRTLVIAGPAYGYVGEPIRVSVDGGDLYRAVATCNDIL